MACACPDRPGLSFRINRDPLGERGGVNLYGFCRNDPINCFDPFGLTEGEASVLKYVFGLVKDPVTAASHEILGFQCLWSVTARDALYDDALRVARGGPPLGKSAGVSGWKQVGLNCSQGVANAANGVQDAAIGIPNAGIGYVNFEVNRYTLGWLTGGTPLIPDIPSPDWSKDLLVRGDSLHGVGKFIGGQSVITLGTCGWGLAVSALRGAAAAEEGAVLATSAVSKGAPALEAGSATITKAGVTLERATVGTSGRAAADALGEVRYVGGRHVAFLEAGEDVLIPAGTKGIRNAMSQLTANTGREVALLRMENGARILRMGDEVSVPLHGGVTRVIAHTHPSSLLSFSEPDVLALSMRGQRSSVIIDPFADIAARILLRWGAK
jgi:hypothetical protein